MEAFLMESNGVRDGKRSADTELSAREIVQLLSVEQKACLCSGAGFWHTKGIKAPDGSTLVPKIMLTDGPHGLRRQPDGAGDHLGISESVPATCFPTAVATAASFDRQLVEEVGAALAEEALQEGVAVVLGPGLNIKRSPLCGRNFEYFSEDPFVSGEMATALVNGVQRLGVGTAVKHFAANSQERKRLVSDSIVDERALREIYLSAFETVVKRAHPASVMTSYNLLNGVYTSENTHLLADILRREWGFDGLVMSDWGGCNDRVAGLIAGQDLEMPASGGYNDRLIAEAVRSGKIDESVLDAAAERVVSLALAGDKLKGTDFRYDPQAHHELARRAAAASAVLLKNNSALLPIAAKASVAVIGAMAKTPRFQGAGSSKINPTRVDSAWDALRAAGFSPLYAAGYALDGINLPDERLILEATKVASKTDIALVFAGLPDEYESEGYDRTSIDMPASHNLLIQAVAEANPNTVVVLHAGAPVSMPWADQVKSILLMYLGGQAVGSATVDLLTGQTNPSGKLAETWPFRVEDTPCFGHFAGEGVTEEYRESVFVGYRFYDTAKKAVAFPFGFGMSYTSFAYHDLIVSGDPEDDAGVSVDVTVTNAGSCRGAEVVQLYVSGPQSKLVYRPQHELKGFDKVILAPGEQKTIHFQLSRRAFAYYNVASGDWAMEGGDYEVSVRASSADSGLVAVLQLQGDGKETLLTDLAAATPVYFDFRKGSRGVSDAEFEAVYRRPLPPSGRQEGEPFTVNSTIDDLRNTMTGKILRFVVPKIMHKMIDENDKNTLAIADRAAFEMPLRALMMQSDGIVKPNSLDAIISLANRRPLQAIKHLLVKA
jgi:beta-glucosidase